MDTGIKTLDQDNNVVLETVQEILARRAAEKRNVATEPIAAHKNSSCVNNILPSQSSQDISARKEPYRDVNQVHEDNGLIYSDSNSLTINSKKSTRSTDEEVKSFATETPLDTFLGFKCGPACFFSGNCFQRTAVQDCWELRYAFWGSKESKAPTTSERRLKLQTILENAICRNKIQPNSKTMSEAFTFCVAEHTTCNIVLRQVCEASFVQLLGLARSWKISQWPRIWSDIKRELVSGICRSPKELISNTQKEKLEHCIAYIKVVAKQTSDASSCKDKEDVQIVAYQSYTQFHREYQRHCLENGVSSDKVGLLKTFTAAFKTLSRVRLLGCKCSFTTCDMCNKDNALLLSSTVKRIGSDSRHEEKRKNIKLNNY